MLTRNEGQAGNYLRDVGEKSKIDPVVFDDFNFSAGEKPRKIWFWLMYTGVLAVTQQTKSTTEHHRAGAKGIGKNCNLYQWSCIFAHIEITTKSLIELQVVCFVSGYALSKFS